MTLTDELFAKNTVKLDSKIPDGPVADKWDNYKENMKLVNPNNKRKFKVIVVGTGLAGASAAATLAELGYQVDAFTFHDSARRAHSIAAQGGINGAKNYKGDGDSVHRLFYDTVKGGDFRAREANVHRLAQVSVDIIDQMVAQGVPFAREYGGLLDNRSFVELKSVVLFMLVVKLVSNCCSVRISSSHAKLDLVASVCTTAQN
jgi:succinate dehydrogenase / fumarate reductase flavoprotein subunit